jgi:hypothetical protein
MKKPKLKVGDLVALTFLDHAENSDKAMLFEAIGRLRRITPKEYVLYFWGYVNEIDRAVDDNKSNENCFAIVRKAILTEKRLR